MENLTQLKLAFEYLKKLNFRKIVLVTGGVATFFIATEIGEVIYRLSIGGLGDIFALIGFCTVFYKWFSGDFNNAPEYLAKISENVFGSKKVEVVKPGGEIFPTFMEGDNKEVKPSPIAVQDSFNLDEEFKPVEG